MSFTVTSGDSGAGTGAGAPGAATAGTDTGLGADIEVPPRPVVESAPGLPMGGMENAKKILANYLADNLPAVCAAMRTVLEVPPYTSRQNLLPIPDMILAYEPPALDAGNLATATVKGATSLLYVSCMNLGRMKMPNFDERTGDPAWEGWYPMTVITWVKGQAWADTIAASNNLITSVRACLLSRMGLNDTEVIRLDPNSYKEQAMEPEVLGGNRHLRAAAASFTMILRESLDIPAYGTVKAPFKPTVTMLQGFSTLPNPAIDPGLSIP